MRIVRLCFVCKYEYRSDFYQTFAIIKNVKNRSDVTKHILRMHQKGRPILAMCSYEDCDFEYDRAKTKLLKLHKMRVHDGIEGYKCPIKDCHVVDKGPYGDRIKRHVENAHKIITTGKNSNNELGSECYGPVLHIPLKYRYLPI